MKVFLKLRKAHNPLAIFCASLCCGLLFFLSACNLYESAEDKSSDKAKMEEAAILIDKGRYEEAESILNKLYNKDPETTNARLLQLLSNSISGQIGLDTFQVLEVIDDLDDGDSSGGIELTGMVLGDEVAWLSRDEIAEKLALLYSRYQESDGESPYEDGAIALLNQIKNKTMDHHAQLGLLSLIDTVLLIGETILYDLDIDGINLTEQGIKDAYNARNTIFPYNPNMQNFVENEPAHFSRIERLNRNVRQIETSIDAILQLSGAENASENDLADIFNEFLNEITDSERNITFNQLVFYITQQL